MDRSLVFRVLVVAKGFEPTFFPKTDPLKGPLTATLKPRAPATMPPSQIILGRVVDPDQKPVGNAVVGVEETRIGDTTHGWPPEGTDPLAVTDETGAFEIRCPQKFDSMHLSVEARKFARKDFQEVRPGPKRQDLTVTVGANLTGRLLRNGKPVNKASIGCKSGSFNGNFVAGTDENGRFIFSNIAPDREYAVYGNIDSLKGVGAFPTRMVHVKGDGSTTDMGTIELPLGWRLEGRVQLSDGQPIPAKTPVFVRPDKAWDATSMELPPDGRFSFSNLPGEVLSMNVRLKGYRHAAANTSLDQMNPYHLIGKLEADKTNMIILLEPGEDLEGERFSIPEEERPRNLPLCGMEVKRSLPGAVTITGRVLDAETQAPVPQFQVTPGNRSANSEHIAWRPLRSALGSNGVFSLQTTVPKGQVLLLIAEASGYLPSQSAPLLPSQTNTVIQLKKGRGPSGLVQSPEGRAITNAYVGYLTKSCQGSVREGRIDIYDRHLGATQRTDAQGRFDFAPKMDGAEIAVACPEGFARVTVASLETNNVIPVQPWSQVRGRLMQKGKPITGEHVDLQFAGGYQSNRPHLHLKGGSTDDAGRFTIDFVPPGELELTTRITDADSRSWTIQKQRSFTAKPGHPLDLGEIEKIDPSK